MPIKKKKEFVAGAEAVNQPNINESRKRGLGIGDRLELAAARAMQAGILPPAKIGQELLTGEDIALRQMQQGQALQDIFNRQIHDQKIMQTANILQQQGVNPEFLKTIGQVPEEQIKKNPELTLGANLKSIIPEATTNILTHAGVGAAGVGATGLIAGSAVPGVGTAIGGGVGALAGGIGGAISAVPSIITSLKAEEVQKTKVAYKDFTSSRTNLKAIIQYAKTGDPIEARNLYNKEIAKIYQAESDLQQLAEYEWLSKSLDELTIIEGFKRDQFIYDQMLIDAITKNPNQNFEFPAEEVIAETE